MDYTHASLFSGCGGFDLAAQQMGWNNAFNCEINPILRRVLKYYWPYAKQYTNIKTTDFTPWRNKIDILSGGFPCQPYSTAGKRAGTEDERHLWPEMLRAIREINRPGLWAKTFAGLLIGQTGWYSSRCRLIWRLKGTKYNRFYFLLQVLTPRTKGKESGLLPTITNFDSYGVKNLRKTSIKGLQRGQKKRFDINKLFISKPYTNPLHNGFQRRPKRFKPKESGKSAYQQFKGCNFIYRQNWKIFPTQSPVCGRDDGLSSKLDGITLSKHRKESLMAYGNAVVHQLVVKIFKAIKEYNTITQIK